MTTGKGIPRGDVIGVVEEFTRAIHRATEACHAVQREGGSSTSVQYHIGRVHALTEGRGLLLALLDEAES